jgi:hypothetical protein
MIAAHTEQLPPDDDPTMDGVESLAEAVGLDDLEDDDLTIEPRTWTPER